MSKRCRAEVVGSMLRPEALLKARAEHRAGRVDDASLKRLEDEAVDAALEIQTDAGVDVVSDGEMRREYFAGPLTEATAGIELGPHGRTITWRRSDGSEFPWRPPISVTGKLRRARFLAVEEFSYARTRASRPLKITLPSPLMLSLMLSEPGFSVEYVDPFDAFLDAAALIKEEARELVKHGCEYIQIDAPELATLVDGRQRDFYESVGVAPGRMLTEGVEILNDIADTPGVTWGVHFCRGNNQGMWMSAGGYGAISQAFGRATNFDVFLLEYDSDRAGDFEPIRDIPQDKTIVLGLVSTKTDQLEPVEMLLDRIGQAARLVGHERLAVSTQCGFASVSLGNPITHETQMAKLRLVSETARRAWPET